MGRGRATLLKLAKVDAAGQVAWLKGPDGARRRIGATDLVDLADPGVEEFVTGPADPAPT